MHTYLAGSVRPATAISARSFPFAGNSIPVSNCRSIGSSLALRLFLAGVFALLGLAGCGGGGGDGSSADSNPKVNSGTIPVGTPPTVSATSPANAATGVAFNASVSATFSEAMTNSTLTSGSFRLANASGAAVAGTVVVTGNTAMFVPSGNLATSTRYTATITTAAKDASGAALAASYAWNFTTGVAPDTTPPTVSSMSPANAASSVATNSSVSATFSEAMTNSTLTSGTFTLAPATGGSGVSGRVTVSGNTTTFTPSVALAASTRYTASIGSSVTDASGNAMGSDVTWSFTTAAAPDTTPPTVSAMSPVNAATGVALNATVSATFSEAMTNSTLTTSTVRLATAGGAAVTGTVNVNGNTVTFTPLAALAGGTQYTATITTAAKDAAGNALAANAAWSFTTGVVADTQPPSTPASLSASAASSSQINLSWSASTDNVAVTNYRIFRDGAAVAVIGNVTSYQNNTGLSASTSYSYAVQALDAAGNGSVQSTTVTAITLAAATSSTGTATLSWDASTASNIAGYRFYYGTASGNYLQPLGQGIDVGNATTYTLTGLTSGVTYYFAVTAYDTAGDESAYSAEASKAIP